MFNKKIQRVLRIARTVRYLRMSQLYWFIRRRVIKTQAVAPVVPDVILCREFLWPTLPQALEPDSSSSRNEDIAFCFLNVSRSFSASAMHWAPQDVNRLWRYNLHYFDFLQDARSIAEKEFLIGDWIEKNPLGSEPAWEPYTASLRIVNWVKYLAALASRTSESCSAMLSSLYQQALWLEKNLEFHILANHYFENLKALLFAGVFFQGKDADRWGKYAVAELEKELREQILPDGCHYERTPQYHCVVLNDVLDLIQLTRLPLAEQRSEWFSPEFSIQLMDAAKKMLVFLADIINPLGQYPLLNDSAFYDVTPLEILRRAKSLGIFLDVASNESSRIVQHHAAGFYGYSMGADWFMIDCGDIGPAYQPGHTHCDMLSYELVIAGIPVVVDSGLLEYEPGEMRRYVRSTAAHNVVQIDDAEQSEIWGEFRVARRARKLHAEIQRQLDEIVFEGSFSGFHKLNGIVHRRKVRIKVDDNGRSQCWAITDEIKGGGNHRLRSYIHLHPAITPSWQGEILSLDYHGKSFANLILSSTVLANVVVKIEDSLFCPEFGLSYKSKKIVLELQSSLPVQFGYTIKRSDLR